MMGAEEERGMMEGEEHHGIERTQTVPPGEERETWVGKLDFVLSCIGYGVGIGDLLRFPYLFIKNGGGAFLIPFLIFMVLCGFPLFYLEVVLGQFSSLSCLAVWKICPLFKGIGYGMVIVSGILSLYYIMMIVWTSYFLAMSVFPDLPWSSCNNTFNTESCVVGHDTAAEIFLTNSSTLTYSNLSSGSITLPSLITSRPFYNSSSTPATGHEEKYRTAAEEFWQLGVLNLSSGIDDLGYPRWQLVICLFVSWAVVFLCLIKGIRSSGRVVYVTVLAPYVLLTVFLVRAATLPGAGQGVLFFLTPEWSRLSDIQVWLEAAIQVFFSLGPAWGGLITMASYNKFKHNCFRDAIATTAADCFTGLFGGLVISCILGFKAHEAGKNIKDIVVSDPGVALVIYPETISRLPIPQLWAFLFFLTLIFLGLDSEFGMFESLCSGICDEFPQYFRGRKTLVTLVLAIAAFLLGLAFTTRGGMYIYQILDWYAGTFSVLTIALLECVIVGWIYGYCRYPIGPVTCFEENGRMTNDVWYLLFYHYILGKGAGYFCEDIQQMTGSKPSLFLRLCWVVVTPLLLLGCLVSVIGTYQPPTLGDYKYPPWAVTIGVLISMVSIAPIPAILMWNILHAKGNICQRVLYLLRPEESWGPREEKTRIEFLQGRARLGRGGWVFRLSGLRPSQPQGYELEAEPAMGSVQA